MHCVLIVLVACLPMRQIAALHTYSQDPKATWSPQAGETPLRATSVPEGGCPAVSHLLHAACCCCCCCCSAREKLLDKRNRVIEEVIKHDPEYKPPADYKPRKFSNKIYIPINEYPGYNFIGEHSDVAVCACVCVYSGGVSGRAACARSSISSMCVYGCKPVCGN